MGDGVCGRGAGGWVGHLPAHLHFPDERGWGEPSWPRVQASFLPSFLLAFKISLCPCYPSLLSSGSLQRLLPHIHFSFKQ